MKLEEMTARNILLVILWSYGLFTLMNFYQLAGIAVATVKTGKGFHAILSGEYESHQVDLIIGLAAFFVGIPLIFLVARFLWGRSFAWMGLEFKPRYLLAGLGLGMLLPFIVILLLHLLGVAKISLAFPTNPTKEIWGILISYACLAVFSGLAEEVAFRGMAAREIALQNGWIVSTLIVGIYFGGAHLLPKLNSLSMKDALWIILSSILVTGLFVALYIRSHSLWVPIGFHIAWNFCLKGILGSTMSGNPSQTGFFQVVLSGNPLLTGGSFGIESSLIAMIVYLAAALLLIALPFFGQVNLLASG
jgi:membrane protease YdiL (CAAX protease family)